MAQAHLGMDGGELLLRGKSLNSEKTVFMKREGKHFIIHGLFVDDIAHCHQQQAQERVHATSWRSTRETSISLEEAS